MRACSLVAARCVAGMVDLGFKSCIFLVLLQSDQGVGARYGVAGLKGECAMKREILFSQANCLFSSFLLSCTLLNAPKIVVGFTKGQFLDIFFLFLLKN